jgi:crotonobetainyl-CoA:carnitine CoA-transferase CaiB-like acyl-CoA transferase
MSSRSSRRYGRRHRGWGRRSRQEAAYFLGVNRNKRSLTVNLAAGSGQKILAGLIEKADVLIDNFKLGTLEKWGFGDAWFEAHAAKVVRCSITGYGSSGPKAAQPGYDFILQAESGLMSICGEQGGDPTKYGVAIVDVCTGMLACNSILAALHARHRTGKGQKVEVSLYETSLAMLVNVASNVLVSGKGGSRFGNGHPSIVPYTTYRAADAMRRRPSATTASLPDRQGARPSGMGEFSIQGRSGPRRNRAAIDGLVGDVLARDSADAWLTKLKAAGVPCGKINSVAGALDDPHTAARNMVETVEHPTVGALKMLGIPFKFSDTPASVRCAPPTLGQHTDEILKAELGLDDDAIARLRREKAV